MKISELLTFTLLSIAFSESVLAKEPLKKAEVCAVAASSADGTSAYQPLTHFRAD